MTDDAEVPLLPLLLATMEERDLVPEDFPDEKPLPWPEHRQIIVRAIARGKVQMAALLATPCGFRVTGGGRLGWALNRWLKRMP